MKLSFPVLSITTLVICSYMPAACAQDIEPVEIGGEADLDACASLGQIVRLDPNGDNFLSVRSGPGSKRQEVDRLTPGAHVTICDKRGHWLGIVYSIPGMQTECGVSSPRLVRSPYSGPCQSGWVHARFVDVVAE